MDELSARAEIATPALTLFHRLWGPPATILAVLITFFLCIPSALAAAIKKSHWVTPLMRLWAWLLFAVCRISVDIEGRENLRGLDRCIIAMNHQSLFDIPISFRLLPLEMRYIAKLELARVPLMGYVIAQSGNVVIDRDSGGRAIRHAMKSLRDGYSIGVFAEGHRHSDNQVHEFSDGAAWLAIATKRPCVPVALCGTLALAPRGAKMARPGQRIRLAIGKPISTTGMRGSDRVELTRRLETAVKEMFREQVSE